MSPAEQNGKVARSPRKILIVDDERGNQLLAKCYLQKIGLASDAADNGRQALGALERGGYAAVLMDIQMPICDGVEATGLIRRSDTIQNDIPIIALTGHALTEDIEAIRASGVDEVLVKPFGFEEFSRVVARALSR